MERIASRQTTGANRSATTSRYASDRTKDRAGALRRRRSTSAPKVASSARMYRGFDVDRALDQVMRALLDFVEDGGEILADNPQTDQLRAAQNRAQHDERRPPRRKAAAAQALNDGQQREAEAEHREHESEERRGLERALAERHDA